MSLNSQFALPMAAATGRKRLDGSERMLDALIGTVIFVVELLIGNLSIYSLFLLAEQSGTRSADFGFLLATAGSGAALVITTIAFIVRVAKGSRSWTAPLTGTLLIGAASFVGYLIGNVPA